MYYLELIKGIVLAIASESGEHGVVFKNAFLEIWQISDPELLPRKSISSWIEYEDLTKKWLSLLRLM